MSEIPKSANKVLLPMITFGLHPPASNFSPISELLSPVNRGVSVSLPTWLLAYEASLSDREFGTDEEMMAVAVEISAQNVAHQTGGPFGTAIYERNKASGKTRLLAVGANRVVPLHNSTLHGEVTAIQFAEAKLQTHSLGSTDQNDYILCTSCEPCCMCLGAVLWSGVSQMMCAATKDDAEAIGFNEGPVFDESYTSLEKAGIQIKRRVLQAAGASVLQKYGETGVIY